MALICYSCSELISLSQEAYHDDQYRAICHCCRSELACQNLTAVIPPVKNSLEISNYLAHTIAYQAFLDQKSLMQDFFAKTQDLPWHLSISHLAYYQAELKNVALIRDQFDRIANLAQYQLQPQDYPVYTFTPPGRIVNKYSVDSAESPYSAKSLVTIVVSNTFWAQVRATQDSLKWDWSVLSRNPNCDLVSYRHNLDFPWDVEALSENPNLSLEWLLAFPDLEWDWVVISSHPSFDLSWLKALPDKNWQVLDLVANANFQITWLNACADLADLFRNNRHNYECFDKLSRHQNFQWSWVELYPQGRWNFRVLSKIASLDFFMSHLDQVWDFPDVVTRLGLTLERLMTYLPRFLLIQAKLKEASLSGAFYSTDEEIKEYRSLDRYLTMVCDHTDLDLVWLSKYLEAGLELNWAWLSYNANFKWSWYQKYPERDWNWSRISSLVEIDG